MRQALIEIAGQRLSYTVTGPPDAPVLILVHGFLSYQGVWEDTVLWLSSSYRCITLDLLGFGDSDKPALGDYSIAAHARRVLCLADALEVNHFALLGHSLGSQIACYIAARLAPQRVTRIVSVAGVVTGQLTPVVQFVSYPQIILGALQPGWYALWRWLAQHPVYASYMFRPWFYRMNALPFEDWAKDRDMALQPGIHIAASLTANAIRSTDLSNDLALIQAPDAHSVWPSRPNGTGQRRSCRGGGHSPS
ncbi:MAG: alpha/beta hydrolase [Candidatus Competibacteraceae bacterium]|nr:alpha/beta hydrolase [Candidatus Competibacteraceae bacterium]